MSLYTLCMCVCATQGHVLTSPYLWGSCCLGSKALQLSCETSHQSVLGIDILPVVDPKAWQIRGSERAVWKKSQLGCQFVFFLGNLVNLSHSVFSSKDQPSSSDKVPTL